MKHGARLAYFSLFLFVIAMMCHPFTLSAAPSDEDAWLDRAPIEHLRSRINALSPDDPLGYFELAEEVSSEIPNVKGRALATRLYVLAFEYDRRSPAPIPLGSSVCLALADLTPRLSDRQWLLALAVSLGAPGYEGASRTAIISVDRTAKVALIKALELYRAGEYRLSLKLLADPHVDQLLVSLSALLDHGSDEIMSELATEPICHECKNRRIVKADLDPNQEYRLCYTCGGDPGPDLADDQLIELLRIEQMLLSDKPQSWSTSLRLTHARPLRDVDPDELAPWAGVTLHPNR